MYKKIFVLSLCILCNSAQGSENKAAIDRKQVELFFDANKISYSVVRDTHAKLLYLEEKAPSALKVLAKIVKHKEQSSGITSENMKWLRIVGLVEAQGPKLCSIIHPDVETVINKLIFESKFTDRILTSHPIYHFNNWPG